MQGLLQEQWAGGIQDIFILHISNIYGQGPGKHFLFHCICDIFVHSRHPRIVRWFQVKTNSTNVWSVNDLRYCYMVGHKLKSGERVWGKKGFFTSVPSPGEESLQLVIIFGDMGEVWWHADTCPSGILSPALYLSISLSAPAK